MSGQKRNASSTRSKCSTTANNASKPSVRTAACSASRYICMIKQHRGHAITHLSRIYNENKNKILNELAKFDQKIESYRKKGFYIKL